MAIKVIHQGTPKPVTHKGKCEGCSSVLEADSTDIDNLLADKHGPFGLLVCPVCAGVGRRTDVGFRPKADYDRLKAATK